MLIVYDISFLSFFAMLSRVIRKHTLPPLKIPSEFLFDKPDNEDAQSGICVLCDE